MAVHLQPPEPFTFEYSVTQHSSTKVVDMNVDITSDLQHRFNHIIRDHEAAEGPRGRELKEEECVALDRRARYLTQLLESRLRKLDTLKSIAENPAKGLKDLLQTQKECGQVRLFFITIQLPLPYATIS